MAITTEHEPTSMERESRVEGLAQRMCLIAGPLTLMDLPSAPL